MISRVRGANSSTYHSPTIILIAGLPNPEHMTFAPTGVRL
jgi:hypothetical protein